MYFVCFFVVVFLHNSHHTAHRDPKTAYPRRTNQAGSDSPGQRHGCDGERDGTEEPPAELGTPAR